MTTTALAASLDSRPAHVARWRWVRVAPASVWIALALTLLALFLGGAAAG